MIRRKLSPGERWERSQRREATTLIVVSGVFVLLGGVLALTGEVVAILVVLFFSACLLAGVMRLPRVSARTALLCCIIACLAFAIACAAIVVLTLAGATLDFSLGSQTLIAIVAAVGAVFFGGGGILLGLLWWRGRDELAAPPEDR